MSALKPRRRRIFQSLSAALGVNPMVNAYRVERAFSYKIRINEGTKRIVTFNGTNDGFGIDISFGMPTHSEYFASEHQSATGLRTVCFLMSDKFWCGLKHLKKFGKSHDQLAGKTWLEQKGALKLKEPQGSDGANLDSLTKKTALHFEPGWLPILLGAVEGIASVTYADEESESFPAKFKGDGDSKATFMGFYSITEIKKNGWSIDLDGWGRTEDDIGEEI
jgi:hypothetical protein